MGQTTKQGRKNANAYTDEFRREIVNLIENGAKNSEITRGYGIANATIRNWIRKFQNSGSFRNIDNLTNIEKELKTEKTARLQAEMERDILKKALAVMLKA